MSHTFFNWDRQREKSGRNAARVLVLRARRGTYRFAVQHDVRAERLEEIGTPDVARCGPVACSAGLLHSTCLVHSAFDRSAEIGLWSPCLDTCSPQAATMNEHAVDTLKVSCTYATWVPQPRKDTVAKKKAKNKEKNCAFRRLRRAQRKRIGASHSAARFARSSTARSGTASRSAYQPVPPSADDIDRHSLQADLLREVCHCRRTRGDDRRVV